jgi:hypothetical protein
MPAIIAAAAEPVPIIGIRLPIFAGGGFREVTFLVKVKFCISVKVIEG